jgi:hypothetical protein
MKHEYHEGPKAGENFEMLANPTGRFSLTHNWRLLTVFLRP